MRRDERRYRRLTEAEREGISVVGGNRKSVNAAVAARVKKSKRWHPKQRFSAPSRSPAQPPLFFSFPFFLLRCLPPPVLGGLSEAPDQRGRGQPKISATPHNQAAAARICCARDRARVSTPA